MNPGGKTPAIVLAISAHDPTGAAGLQADIEAVNACGGRCVSLLTGTTAQNTRVFECINPQPLPQLRHAARLLSEDLRFSACKIGMLCSAETADFVAEWLEDLPGMPVVLDPILAAGAGTRVADDHLLDCIRNRLLQRTTVATPNRREAEELGLSDDMERAAEALMRRGAANVLVTGADQPTPTVVNVLYRQSGPPTRYEYERLPNRYHGSGCTLAAALATLLARGFAVDAAVVHAQDYTWHALRSGRRLGGGQWHPDRAASGHGEPEE